METELKNTIDRAAQMANQLWATYQTRFDSEPAPVNELGRKWANELYTDLARLAGRANALEGMAKV